MLALPRLAFLAFLLAPLASIHGDPAAQPLWPGQPPGETKALPPEADQFRSPPDPLIAGRPIIRLGNVSTPTLTIYRPAPDRDTGATVVVFPGGGYHILALDLEGTEVCEWLNSLGVTGVLLKYRVPRREVSADVFPPLQDAQRAIGLVRQQASELGLDPHRIGVLGFSAGAHLAATLGVRHTERAYPVVDEADAFSCRPDFALLIYPGGLLASGSLELQPGIVPQKDRTPPTFLVMAQDDPVRVENALAYYLGLKKAGVPAEMHLYPSGGHGYGLRRTDNLVTTWPERAADWLQAGGWLTK